MHLVQVQMKLCQQQQHKLYLHDYNNYYAVTVLQKL